MLFGMAWVGWQWRQAVEARNLADERFEVACLAIEEMLARLSQEDVSRMPQMDPVRRELLEKVLRLDEAFQTTRPDDSTLLARTAKAAQQVEEVLARSGLTR